MIFPLHITIIGTLICLSIGLNLLYRYFSVNNEELGPYYRSLVLTFVLICLCQAVLYVTSGVAPSLAVSMVGYIYFIYYFTMNFIVVFALSVCLDLKGKPVFNKLFLLPAVIMSVLQVLPVNLFFDSIVITDTGVVNRGGLMPFIYDGYFLVASAFTILFLGYYAIKGKINIRPKAIIALFALMPLLLLLSVFVILSMVGKDASVAAYLPFVLLFCSYILKVFLVKDVINIYTSPDLMHRRVKVLITIFSSRELSSKQAKAMLETQLFMEAVHRYNGNIKEVCQDLDISESNAYARRKKVSERASADDVSARLVTNK